MTNHPYKSLIAIGLFAHTFATASAAPLEFRSKAQDALMVLKEKGIILDVSLRGDRALTRWEMATILARLLSLNEANERQLLSKAELKQLEKGLQDLEPELSQLGVRLDGLEEKVDLLEQRVSDRERIRFKGKLVSVYAGASFSNNGRDRSGGAANSLEYDTIVGSTAASNPVPHAVQGIVPSIDLIKGRPWLNGTAMTTTLYLDIEADPDPDWLLNTRIYAYSSQGTQVLDSVYGGPAPYLANAFTGQPSSNGQSINRAPFTQMGLDRFQATHLPSGTTVTLGTFRPKYISTALFSGQVNPAAFEPRFLESYGFHVSGDQKISPNASLGWELFGTYLPDGNPPNTALNLSPYRNEAYGGSLQLNWGKLRTNFGYFRAASQASDGQFLANGLSNLVNGDTGQVNINWVNPAPFFASNLSNLSSAGLGSTSDQRPIPGLTGSDAAGGSFGPQGITLGGTQMEYRSENWSVRGEYAHSSYRPNRNSPYTSEGDLFRFGGSLELLDRKLQLSADYRHTDPNYDPMILSYPGTSAGLNPFRVYHRFPDFDQFWHLYSLHDTDQFPHNRQGLVASALWRYDDEGSLKLRYRAQTQVTTSLQDVRYQANQLGAGLPKVQVLGFSPGFFDVVFREYSPLSFDANLQPLEDRRGSVHAFGLDWNHHFSESPFSVELGYDQYHFFRPSGLTAALGGSQNQVDLVSSIGHLRLGYEVSKDLGLGLGYDFGQMRGHYDPLGVYNSYAIANGTTDFRNRDTFQHQPFIDAKWKISEKLTLDTDFRIIDSVDRVPESVFAGTPGGPFSLAHPFSYSGYQFRTKMEFSF